MTTDPTETPPTPDPEAGRTTSDRRFDAGWIIVALASLVGVVQTLRHSWLSDDLFITLRYCDNLLAGNGAVYNVGERVEGYTHFLWFLILTLGRMLSVPPEILGRFLGLPFFVASIVVLFRISRRLLPAAGGWSVPLAALAWALTVDVQLYTSGGLETIFFTLLLLIGFDQATRGNAARHVGAAGAAFALATLTRPEGLLLSILALLGVMWLRGSVRSGVRFALIWLLLTTPHLVFRLAYYGQWFPNTFYAKSGHLPYWSQGIWYLWTWVYVYPVLALSIVAAVVLLLVWLRQRRPEPLMLAAALGFAGYLGVTRGGGDYMFGRFFLPFTPFLWLLLEWLLHRVGRRGVRATLAIVLCASVLVAPVLRARNLSEGRYWGDVADEPRLGTLAAWKHNRERGALIAQCLENSDATVFIQGGQCVLGYYGRFPKGIEEHGLTDLTIAHYEITKRTRPGHEKLMTAAEVFERPVHFRLHYARLRNARYYTNMAITDGQQTVFGEILVYDRELMDSLKDCDNLNFIDFPAWLRHEYIPNRVPVEAPTRLLGDYEHFLLYYFFQNENEEDLLHELQQGLEARGLRNLDQVKPVPRVMGFDYR